MEVRRVYRRLVIFILIILWPNLGHAFYPFCHDVNIVYLGRPGSLLEQWAVEFKKELKRQFTFRDKVEVFASVNLGLRAEDIRKEFESGKFHIAIVPSKIMVRTVPSFTIFNFPGFVARDYEIEALQSKRNFLRGLEAIATDRGVSLLGVGWRFTTLSFVSERSIKSLADLKGNRIGIAYKEHKGGVDVFGAKAVQMPFSETYMALQKGAIDGTMSFFENSFVLAKQKSIKSIVTFERGGFDSMAYVLLMRKELFYKPDEAGQDKVRRAAQIASKRFAGLAIREREAFIGELGRLKVNVNMLKDKEYILYQNSLERKVWPELIWGKQAEDLLRLRKSDIE